LVAFLAALLVAPAISVDPPQRNLAWTKQLDLPFRLLSDVETAGGVSRQYGVWDDTWNLAKRVTFVVDRAGRVRFVDVGSLAIDTSRTLEALQRLAQTW
jgi:peroxiredoxin